MRLCVAMWRWRRCSLRSLCLRFGTEPLRDIRRCKIYDSADLYARINTRGFLKYFPISRANFIFWKPGAAAARNVFFSSCFVCLLLQRHSPPQTWIELSHSLMDPTGVSVALIGRNSKCKALFLKAASSSEQPVSDATTQIDVWWTPSYVPGLTEADIVQAPVHGFSPSGERLLQAQLRHVSVAEIVEMKAKEGGGSGGGGRYHSHPALLLLVSADMMFHNGRPRPGRGAVNLVKAAVSRARERLGSSEAPIAVAVSVDVQEEGGKGQQISSSSSVKALLSSVKDEMGADGVPVIAVSPRTELWLREQEREGGRVSYRRGDSQFRVSEHHFSISAFNSSCNRYPAVPRIIC